MWVFSIEIPIVVGILFLFSSAFVRSSTDQVIGSLVFDLLPIKMIGSLVFGLLPIKMIGRRREGLKFVRPTRRCVFTRNIHLTKYSFSFGFFLLRAVSSNPPPPPRLLPITLSVTGDAGCGC